MIIIANLVRKQNKDMISYCLTCKKEVSDETSKCECGGTCFVYGNKFHFDKDNNVTCNCGEKKFKTTQHMDMTNKAITNYVCTKCGNVFGVESYRTGEDLWMWEDN